MGEFHRLFRRLDDDPYSDVRWGVVTANHWPAAMEIVRATKPLAIGSMLSNTPVPLEVAEDSTYFDEGVAGRRVERAAGGADGDPRRSGDRRRLARAFDRLSPDLLVTSGRTNEERWMIGYTFDGGRVVVAEDGSLPRTPEGEEFPIEAEGPMAMLGAGSCLLGYVPRAGVLPMRFVDHAGARQIVGYCSTTWHGAGGWDLSTVPRRARAIHPPRTRGWRSRTSFAGSTSRFPACPRSRPRASTNGRSRSSGPPSRNGPG